MVVGVLALQGSFNEHIAALRRVGVKGIEVRKAEQLEKVSFLIIPGGESTTMAKLAHFHFLALREFVRLGKPVWGTCAGLIFLADKAVGQKEGGQELVGGLDCTVHRNYFGSQLQSFEACLSVAELSSKEGGPETFHGVFIRAPTVLEAVPEVKEGGQGGLKVIVAVRQGNLLGTAFHPELTSDSQWHSYFLKMAGEVEEGTSNSIVTIASSSDLSLPVNEHAVNDLPILE
ncbi:hypothetical protein MLD38_025254 [Melastoma candidum]|uniref:Uncharacterized protein n=1 Tax=Melastoma candidum TaxID=119954 RepID=A0ACB9P1Q5_9MYRT|nr:hypothetical protein MLD38_025254 [Melastoma candidum]